MSTRRKLSVAVLAAIAGLVQGKTGSTSSNSGSSKNLRVCDYERDLQVEFSECDPYGTKRNGKSNPHCQKSGKLTRVFFLSSFLLRDPFNDGG